MATDLENLDPDDVLQAEELLISFIQEMYPSMDLSTGRVLRDMLIKPAAMFHVMAQEDLDKLRQSWSLAAIEANPELADPDMVDGVLSNYRVTRNTGTAAAGQVVIVIPELLTTVVSADTSFYVGDLRFVAARAFVGVTTEEAAIIDPTTQRHISERSDGTYSFVIDVVADTVGSAYKLLKDTAFTSVDPAPAGFIRAYALYDFSGGTDTETNAELIERFREGISPSVMSGRTQINAIMRGSLPTLVSTSIIGYGDPEMIRDRHNIFSISHGGKADVYAKTAEYPSVIGFELEATCIDVALGKWQIAIDRDVYPGFYTVDSVLPLGTQTSDLPADSCELVEEVRSLNLTPRTNEFVPEITNLIEGAYSAYQTAIVKFIDTDTVNEEGLAVGATRTYQVYINGMPGIRTLQDMTNGRQVRNPQADYLVRAPIPAFCNLSIEVQYTEDADEPDATELKTAIVNAVNSLNFDMGRLPVSIIDDAVHNVAGAKHVIVASPIQLECRIMKPGGGYLDMRSSSMLTVPNLPQEGISSRTTLFYLGFNDIDMTITKVPVLPV